MSTTLKESRWKTGWKKVNTTAFKGLDKVGAKVNNWSNKIGVEGFWPGPMPGELEKCARILRTFSKNNHVLETADEVATEAAIAEGKKKMTKKQKVLVKIPPKVIQNAHGLAIFTVCRTGFVISGASGSGVVMSRMEDGTWGPPSGILIHTIGWGFLAGADIYDVVLVLRNRKAVEAFAHPKVSLGAELSVAAGPLGTGAQGTMGIEAAPVFSYVKSKGLYGGIQLDGNIIIERNDENARFYGQPGVKAKQILSVNPPPYLAKLARPYEGDPHHEPHQVKEMRPLMVAIAAAEGRMLTAAEEAVLRALPSVSPAEQAQAAVDEGQIKLDSEHGAVPAIATADDASVYDDVYEQAPPHSAHSHGMEHHATSSSTMDSAAPATPSPIPASAYPAESPAPAYQEIKH